MEIRSSKDLDNAIAELERRREIQEQLLSDQFHATVDHFKPGNLIKSALKNVAGSGEVQNSILKTAGGIGVGLLTKKLLLGKTSSFAGKLASNALKLGAANSVLNNADKIKAWGTALYKNLFAGKKKPD